MADVVIGAAPAGQPGAVSAQGGDSPMNGQTPAAAPEASQPQVNYVTSEQLNAAMERIERLVQSSTDKSYNRVQKMIDQMKQAGIQNPTADQARAMLAATGQSEQQQAEQDAQPAKSAAASPEAEKWIKDNGGDVTKDCWNDIYDAAMEAGVGMITRDDPEFAKYFMAEGQIKSFDKPRQFVRAFEQAFAEKKERVGAGGTVPNVPNLAGSPALGAGGVKSNYHNPKTTDRMDLITQGLREKARR